MSVRLANWGLAARFAAVMLVALIAATFVNFAITFAGPPPMRRPVPVGEVVSLVDRGAAASREFSWVTGPAVEDGFRPGAGERPLPRTALAIARSLALAPADVRLTALEGRRADGMQDPTNELRDGFTLGIRQANGMWRIVRGDPAPLVTRWHWVTLGSAMAAALAFAALAALVARSVVRPLDRLGHEADRANLGKESAITLKGPPEVVRVARAVAAMRDRLASAIENRTALFTAVAHDMAAPVARLRFRLNDLPERQRAAAEADLAELSELISGIVEFSAIGRQPLPLAELDAIALARDVAERERVPFVGDATAAIVKGDAAALRRLLTNLVVNARRHGGGGEVSACIGETGVCVSVADRGPGVPAEHAARIFDPFYRVEHSRSRETAGAGLGLAIAHSIAVAHAGDLRYSPRPGGGAIFALTMPLPCSERS